MLAPLTIENSGCHHCNQMKSAALSLWLVWTQLMTGGESQSIGRSEDARSCVVVANGWDPAMAQHPNASLQLPVLLLYKGCAPHSQHRSISSSTWTTDDGFADGTGWGCASDLLAEYWRGNWESRCLGRPSASKAFITSLRNDPWMCCVYNRDMNQCKGI